MEQAYLALQEENFSFKTTRDLYGICATGAEDTNYVTATQTCRAFIAAAVQYHDEVTNRKNLKPGVYQLPKERLTFGPIQVEAMIDQNTLISEQLSLWDQRGSRVIRGNLIVIPIENSFLYD